MIEERSGAVAAEAISTWLVVVCMAGIGTLVGLGAQLLRQDGGAYMTLGAGAALWITIGFLLVMWAARRWSGPEGVAWASVAAAAYLYAWLIAYHVLFGRREHLAFAQVWPQVRFWIAAVAPACITIGFVARSCLKEGRLGDVCLGFPLGWSLPEVFLSARLGGSYITIVVLPIFLTGVIPLIVMRGRRWNPLLTAVAVIVSTGAFYFLHPYLQFDNG